MGTDPFFPVSAIPIPILSYAILFPIPILSFLPDHDIIYIFNQYDFIS